MKLLHEGKAKKVFLGEKPDQVIVQFKDDLTAFNAEKKANLAGKGQLACDITVNLMTYLEENGIKTHFLGRLSSTSILARRLDIVPLEVIIRFVAAGSMCRRYGIEKGKRLNPPVLEFSLKDDRLGDPLICPEHIIALDLATPRQLDAISDTAKTAALHLRNLFKSKELQLVDMKFEFGTDKDGDIYLADEISPDTMRVWTMSGQSLDKDLFREDQGDVLAGYREIHRRLSQ